MKQRYLFIHQNFPGQFVHVAAELVRQGCEVVAICSRKITIEGVQIVNYQAEPLAQSTPLPALRDLEAQSIRANVCARVMHELSANGFTPDVVVAHPGWGEALFCKDVWPNARLVIYAEFFYSAVDSDFGFDPEFFVDSLAARMRIRMKNTVHLQAFSVADTIYSPTEWQKSRLPVEYQSKARVAFDGIDTNIVRPNPDVQISLIRDKVTLNKTQEIITFVNRNLEPYRGFHIFMRALPAIMAARPNARCLIIGRDGVSYGASLRGGETWRNHMLREVQDQLPMDRIHFLGGLPYQDYLKVIQLSTCHVYMTYPFVLSWSCLEAMSVGAVVVASRTKPVEEVIEHGRNGLLVDFFDVAALSRQVIDVLAAPKDYNHLGQAARQTVVDRYDLKSHCLPEQLILIKKFD